MSNTCITLIINIKVLKTYKQTDSQENEIRGQLRDDRMQNHKKNLSWEFKIYESRSVMYKEITTKKRTLK